MSTYEATIRKAVEDRVIPGAILLAKDKSGSLDVAQAYGYSSIEPGAEKALELDAVFTLMSMTKLMTTVAAMQLVDRGELTLDSDVAPWLPRLAAQGILKGFDDEGRPVLARRQKAITLRHLLTHSAGLAYDFMTPDLMRWTAATGGDPTPSPERAGPLEERFDFPLLYEPGEGWSYGTATDFAGVVVEKVSGLSLEDYMGRFILAPLGIADVTFYPERRPELAARMWGSITVRPEASTPTAANPGSAGGGAPAVVHGANPFRPAADGVCLGGAGLHADVVQYFRLLESLLRDDGALLRPETAALMFRPQLTAASREALLGVLEHPEWIVGDIPPTRQYDWGLGGLVVDGDDHSYRKKGALFWGGMYNLAWIIDPTAGLCSIWASNFLPAGDDEARKLMRAWEKEVYSRAKA